MTIGHENRADALRFPEVQSVVTKLGRPELATETMGGPAGPAMTLTTTVWPDGGQIPARYSQAGEQVSPALTWTNAPAATVSFVVHMLHPDVAINRGTETQVHWLVWNIPGAAKGLAEGIPQGAQRPDGSRQISATGPVYRGPGAPATGTLHHYTIEVYALDVMLEVQPATAAQPAAAQPAAAAVDTRTGVFKAMAGHVLGKAVYVGLFRRA